ncbi:Phenylacetate--CoA ligase [Saliniradius amylolyticus]|uniref:Phenylacetate--CoA ligase n=1 Tax=Saliniradius amylolyticus TaxID=2183582 RepID=A0A2S2E1Z2_9ALTE|nr:phenylacetate--CoA ligase family protein [Saliniradius amylolyticus]AWL11658.1 Phenylacetate--CoA ligase [Saliniradius amylolyticus]
MAWYPWMLNKVLLPVYQKLRSKPLLDYLDEYKNHLNWTEDQLREHQWQQLLRLLTHCFEHSPFYRQHWQRAGLDSVQDIRSRDDFTRLPPVNKSVLTEHRDRVLAQTGSGGIRKSTGGSTGQPFHFELNPDSNTRREAVMWRAYGWLGAGLGHKTLYLWGTDVGPQPWSKRLRNRLYHGFYNRTMLNAFAMRSDNLDSYVNEVNRVRPEAIVGYVNPLFELARYIVEKGLTVYQPNAILTGAEPLFESQRQIIEQAFGAPTYNTYGCREVMLIAAECQAHKRLHINSDQLMVEALDEQGQSLEQGSGDLALTDLFNYRMPLVRYLNGDRVSLAREGCGCGNPLPVMDSAEGRKLDMLRTPSGAHIPGELFPHLFKEFPEIKRFQVRQSQLDSLDVLLECPLPLGDEAVERLQREVDKYSQGELRVNVRRVPSIPLNASGKHRVTICEL